MTERTASRVVSCPNCGAVSPLRNPGIVTLICEHCQTTLVREGAAFRAGTSSLLVDALSGIGVGSRGVVVRRVVEVVGRIRCEHPRGFWEEWYLEGQDGQGYWLIEEEGSYKLEREVGVPSSVHGMLQAEIGTVFDVEGTSFQVIELGEATTVGGQGQLPRHVEQGERFRYVDLGAVNGTEVLTVEQTPDGGVLVFRGQSISSRLVELSAEAQPVVEEQGRHEECRNCGGALEIPLLPQPVQTLSCAYCGGLHEVSGSVAHLLQTPEQRKDWALPIGEKGELFGVHYEVVGRMVYLDQEYDDGLWKHPCTTQEILLLSEDDRFVTLELGVDGVALLHKQARVPPQSEVKALTWGDSIEHGSRSYRMYEEGRSKLLAVDGALPWRARVGDTGRYVDSLDLPGSWTRRTARRLSVEWSDDDGQAEVECFVAQYVSVPAIRKAFPKIWLPDTVGQSPLRPHPLQGGPPRFGLVLFLVGILNLAAAWIVGAGLGDPLIETVATAESKREMGTTTSAVFEIEEGTRFVELELDSNLNNGWIWMDISLLRADDGELVGTMGADMEYYSGNDGEESWSEGSARFSRVYQAPEPGSYVMEVTMLDGGDQRDFRVAASLREAPLDTAQPWRLGIGLISVGLLLIVLAALFTRNPWRDS